MTRSKTNILVLAGIIVGGLLGVVLGRYLPDLMLSVSFIGKLYTNALLFTAALMLFAGALAGAAEAFNYRQGTLSGPRLWVLSTAVTTVAFFGILVFLLGGYAFRNGGGINPNLPVWESSKSSADFLISLVPQWMVTGVFLGQFVGVLLLTLLTGAMLHKMTSRGRTIASFFSELCGGLRRVNNLFFYAAPVGVLFLTAACVALPDHEGGVLLPLSTLWYPCVLVVALVIYSALALPLMVQTWSRRRLEELADKTRGTSSEPSESGFRQRHGRYEGGDQRSRGRYEGRGGDRGGDRGDRGERGRSMRPPQNRGPRPDRPPFPRESSSPFAVKASSDSPFEQPSTPSEPASEPRPASSGPSDSGSQPRREYGGPRREYDRDRRGGERAGGRDRDRDRDRRGGGHREDRGRSDRRPGGRPPYQSPSPEPANEPAEEASPNPITITPPVPELISPSPSRSFEDNVFGRPGSSGDDTGDQSDQRESDAEGSAGGEQSPESTEVQYGRSRHRRYPQPNSEPEEKSENAVPAPAAPEEPTSSEPIEFGRFRRKRFGDK